MSHELLISDEAIDEPARTVTVLQIRHERRPLLD